MREGGREGGIFAVPTAAFAVLDLGTEGDQVEESFFKEEMKAKQSNDKSGVSSITTDGDHAERTTHHELPLNTWRPAEIRKNFCTRRGGAVRSTVALTIQQRRCKRPGCGTSQNGRAQD